MNVFKKAYRKTVDTSMAKEFLSKMILDEPPNKFIEFDEKIYLGLDAIDYFSVNDYCSKCQKSSAFTANIEDVMDNVFSDDVMAYDAINRQTNLQKTEKDFFKNRNYFFNIELICPVCSEKHSYSFVFNGNKVIKIGQYPTFAKQQTYEILKYKNIIPKYYTELTRSLSAYSQNMGIASFVYLRRILEHLIDTKLKNIEGKKFIDKLKEVEESEKIIPDEFQEIKGQIYTILSKGIHQYEEDECLNLYLAVKYIICSILDFELQKKENIKKSREAVKAIRDKLGGRE